MKTIISALSLVSILTSTTAFASYAGPLLTKYSDSGIFTPPPAFTSVTCEIFPAKVVITTNVGKMSTIETRMIQTSGIAEAIELASLGKIEEEMIPTDGNALVYSAYKILPNDQIEKVDLGTYTGGRPARTINRSLESDGLRNLADQLCQ